MREARNMAAGGDGLRRRTRRAIVLRDLEVRGDARGGGINRIVVTSGTIKAG